MCLNIDVSLNLNNKNWNLFSKQPSHLEAANTALNAISKVLYLQCLKDKGKIQNLPCFVFLNCISG